MSRKKVVAGSKPKSARAKKQIDGWQGPDGIFIPRRLPTPAKASSPISAALALLRSLIDDGTSSLGKKAVQRDLFDLLAESFAREKGDGLAGAAAELISAVRKCTVDFDYGVRPDRSKYVQGLHKIAAKLVREGSGGPGRASKRSEAVELMLKIARSILAGECDWDGQGGGWTGENPEVFLDDPELTEKLRKASETLIEERAKMRAAMTRPEKAASVLWEMMPQRLPEIRKLRRRLMSENIDHDSLYIGGGAELARRKEVLLRKVRAGKFTRLNRFENYGDEEIFVRVAKAYGHETPRDLLAFKNGRAARAALS